MRPIIRIVIAVALAIFVILVASCSSVLTSTPAKLDQKHPKRSTGLVYFLPRTLVRLEAVRTNDSHYKITLHEIVEPDRSHMYRLDYNSSTMAWDTLGLTVNEQGFLVSINATNADRTVDIGKKLFEIAAEATRAAAKIDAELTSTEKAKLERLELIFDPTDSDSIKVVSNKLTSITEGEITIQATGIEAVAKTVLKQKGAEDKLETKSESARRVAEKRNGAFYRPRLPYYLRVITKDQFVETRIDAPNRAPLFYYDIRRAPFVTESTQLGFSNGFLTQVTINKPSEVEGFLTLPLEALKTVTSIPTNLIQFRINHDTAEKNLVEAQKNLISQQIELLKMQTALQQYLATNRPAGRTN